MRLIIALTITITSACIAAANSEENTPFSLKAEQITSGPKQHFFGYIGHVRHNPQPGNRG